MCQAPAPRPGPADDTALSVATAMRHLRVPALAPAAPVSPRTVSGAQDLARLQRARLLLPRAPFLFQLSPRSPRASLGPRSPRGSALPVAGGQLSRLVHPRNPMGRTGLRGRGALSFFGPNHTLQPVVTR